MSVAVLVFDSASVAVLERMLAAGRLESLTALSERGRRLELETPARDFAAGAFYTLYSGVELADHGIFYPFQWAAGEQRVRFADAFEAPPAVWERLAAGGRRTLAIDPYECRPPARAEGILISGWGFEERVVLPRWARPRGADRELRRRLGAAPRATEIFGRPAPRRLLALRERLLAAPDRVASAAVELLGRESFDLVWLTFSAAHLAGHQFWDLSQISSDGLAPGARAKLAGALKDIYEAVDRAIGRVLAALPADTDVIVTSAVGMDVNTSRADLLPGMLEAILSGGPVRNESGSVWRLRAAVPPGARAAVADLLPNRLALELTARLELGAGARNALAFAHPADNQGYVRLNLRGRERDGVVTEDEADSLLERIAEGLADFHDPDGEPCVARVEQTAERYSGTHADRLPDLVVNWSPSPATRLDRVVSERFGELRRQGAGSGRSGNHTAGDAWALLAPASARHRDPGRPARLADVAATVASLTGASTDGLSGEPLLEA